jgi:hypothetical protein
MFVVVALVIVVVGEVVIMPFVDEARVFGAVHNGICRGLRVVFEGVGRTQ